MKPKELARVRERLLAFAEEMFASLPRSDQRRWGEVYLRGLMLDGRRKSIEPMAARYVLFFLIASLVMGSAHRYVWARLVRDGSSRLIDSRSASCMAR